MGGARFLGEPLLTPAHVFLTNTRVPSSHPERRFRVDVTALTGASRLVSTW